jgi:dolichol-phosphate mannosyltransferase
MHQPSMDVVIPVFNEGENIVRVLASFEEHVRRPIRVLICYDFEEDDTLPAVRSRQWPFVVDLVRNRGRGAHSAIVTGFAHAAAPCIVVFPADDTINARILDSMAGAFDAGAEIVAASRFIKGGSMIGCPWLKALLVRTAAFTLHVFARVPTHDPTNGFRLFSKRVIDTIPIESSVGFTYSLELLVKADRRGWKISEVPSTWIERTAGKSRFKVLRWVPAYLRWYLYAFLTPFHRLVRHG